MNDEHTEIWLDPWINGYSLVDSYGWTTMAISKGRDKKISTLIIGNKWKNYLEYVPIQIHNIVHNITIHAQKQENFWYWIPGKDGQFISKTAWNHIRVKNIEFNWAKIIWHKNNTPKMTTCALLAKLNRLNTKETITRWNNNVDQSCVFCLNQQEDRDHLFSIVHIQNRF